MRRTVIVETQRKTLVPASEAKGMIISAIARVIRRRRIEVENALIATGSPKAIRGYDAKRFNKEVMRRLSETGPNGDQFRKDMTTLLAVLEGSSLNSDGFFRVEPKAGSSGMGLLFPTEEKPTPEGEILPYTETTDGGVNKQGENQNVGEILSGSAQVIDSIGGIIGLFTGQQQTEDVNQLNNAYNQGGYAQPAPEKKGGTLKWVIIGLLVVAAIVGVVYYVRKNQD